MKPYTYLIGWSKSNLWYYGCQYNRNSDPSQLWKTYFTSSKNVKRLREILGEPDIIQIRKIFKDKVKCVRWEGVVLRRMKMKDKKHQWINRSYKDALGIVKYISTGFTEQHIENMKASWTVARKRKFSETHIPHNKGVPMTEDAKRHLSELNTGKKHGPSHGKTGPKVGTKQSPDHISKRVANQIATLQDPARRRRMSESIKGRKFYTDGSRRYLLQPTDSKIKELNLRIGF
jgi:hypothetical protein